jgi:hypothetical protein
MTRLTAPYDMADAMRTLTDPAAHCGHPAIRQTCWLFLKEARGQTVDLARLDQIHRVLPPAPRQVSLVDVLDAARARVLPRIHARRDELAGPHTAETC